MVKQPGRTAWLLTREWLQGAKLNEGFNIAIYSNGLFGYVWLHLVEEEVKILYYS